MQHTAFFDPSIHHLDGQRSAKIERRELFDWYWPLHMGLVIHAVAFIRLISSSKCSPPARNPLQLNDRAHSQIFSQLYRPSPGLNMRCLPAITVVLLGLGFAAGQNFTSPFQPWTVEGLVCSN